MVVVVTFGRGNIGANVPQYLGLDLSPHVRIELLLDLGSGVCGNPFCCVFSFGGFVPPLVLLLLLLW